MSVANLSIGAQFKPRNGSLVTWAEIALLAGIVIAVLAFGGTETTSFSLVEILYASIAIILLLGWRSNIDWPDGKALALPALLIGMALLQVCPIPISWSRVLGNRGADGARFGTISIEPYATRVQLLILITCVLAFWIAYVVSRNAARRRNVINVIIGLGVFEALYGLAQYLAGWQNIFGYQKKFDLEEATGTYINRNHYAGLLEMVLPFALALGFHELWKLRRNHGSAMGAVRTVVGGSDVYKLVYRLSMAVVIFAALIFSRSRMGILAACTATLLVLGLVWSARTYRKAGLAVCAAFLLMTAALAGWIGAGSVVERFQGVRDEYAAADHSRLSIWRDTVHLIGTHPWVGTGLGTYPIAFTQVQTTFLNAFVNHAHNDYLELASDVGIPLAAVIAASFLWLFARAVRAFYWAERRFDRFAALACTGSLAAILLHSLVDFNLYIPANALMFAAISGVTLSLQTKPSGGAK